MADWVKITDLVPATSGGAAVPHAHFLNLDRVVAVSYRDPEAHQGQAGPTAEVHVGEQQPIRLFSDQARDLLRTTLEQRAAKGATGTVPLPPPAVAVPRTRGSDAEE